MLSGGSLSAPPTPRGSTIARSMSTRMASSSSGSSVSSSERESNGEITEKNGFSVVAPTKATLNASTDGNIVTVDIANAPAEAQVLVLASSMPSAVTINQATVSQAQSLAALQGMSRDLVEMVMSFRPTRGKLFRAMIIPAILPDILTAWKVNLGNASRVVVVAELGDQLLLTFLCQCHSDAELYRVRRR